jgi:hypothetical protein
VKEKLDEVKDAPKKTWAHLSRVKRKTLQEISAIRQEGRLGSRRGLGNKFGDDAR